MASKRMFAKDFLESDTFLDMPLSTQALYFHLAVRADDDGFINNPKRIQKILGCNDDDLKLLIAKGFIIPFDSGIVVVRHWRVHNTLRPDRYKETLYKQEKAMLVMHDKMYELNPSLLGLPNGIPTVCQNGIPNGLPSGIPNGLPYQSIENTSVDGLVYQWYPQNRLDKNSIDKTTSTMSIDDVCSFFKNTYNNICDNFSPVKAITEKRKNAIKLFLDQFSYEQFIEICNISNGIEYFRGKNDSGWKADFDFLINVDKAVAILEGKYNGYNGDSDKKQKQEQALAELARIEKAYKEKQI